MGRHSADAPAALPGDEPDDGRPDFGEDRNYSPPSIPARSPPGYSRRVGVAIGIVMLGVILLVFGIVTLTTGDDPQTSAGQDTTVLPPTPLPPTPAETVSTSQPAPVTTTSAAPESSQVLPVTVLNNSPDLTVGLATRVAAALEAGGWPITELLNYSETQVPVTTVFFTPGNEAEEAAAHALVAQFPEITGGAEPRFEGLDGVGLTVAAVGDWVP
ncbi:MAG: LytR C-terminal domain-containing protein [Geodermatophilaceae bacterium]